MKRNRVAAAEVEGLRAEIARLDSHARELGRALGEFDHQARRCRDGIERHGGRSPELEGKLAGLADNLRRTRREAEEAHKRLAGLREALAALEARATEGE